MRDVASARAKCEAVGARGEQPASKEQVLIHLREDGGVFLGQGSNDLNRLVHGE